MAIDTSFYISAKEYLMGRDKIAPLTEELIINLNTLIPRVNQLLEVFYTQNPNTHRRGVDSGYRPAVINRTIKNAATHSNHMICAAVDLEDKDGLIDEWCLKNLDQMEKFGLWLESPQSTVGWSHWQCVAPHSGNRVFNP